MDEIYELRFGLSIEVSSSKYEELTEEEVRKIADELKEILDAEWVQSLSMSERVDYLDTDPEAVCYLIKFRELYDTAFAHVCISDPEDIEAIFTDITNSQEILKHIDKKLAEKNIQLR